MYLVPCFHITMCYCYVTYYLKFSNLKQALFNLLIFGFLGSHIYQFWVWLVCSPVCGQKKLYVIWPRLPFAELVMMTGGPFHAQSYSRLVWAPSQGDSRFYPRIKTNRNLQSQSNVLLPWSGAQRKANIQSQKPAVKKGTLPLEGKSWEFTLQRT